LSARAYLLAVDQGTTSSRALVFDQDWHIAGLGHREHPQTVGVRPAQ